MKIDLTFFRRLWRMRKVGFPGVARQPAMLVGLLMMSLLLTAFELLRPQPIRFLFDGLLLPNPEHLPDFLLPVLQWSPGQVILAVCAAVIGLALGTALVNYWLEVRLAYLGNKLVTRVRKVAFRHLIALPNLFHDSQKTGDLVLRLTGDIQMIRELFLNFVISFVGRITLIFGMLAVMLMMNARLTFVALALMPLMMWTAVQATGKVNRFTRQQRKQESKVAQSVHEIIGEMRVFAAYGRLDLEDEKFDADNRRSGKNDVKSRRVRARLAGTTELTLAAGVCCVIGLGTLEIMNGRMSAGELLVFLSYLRSMFKPIRSLMNLLGRTGKATACAERVLDILETPIELQNAPDAVEAPPFRGGIELRGVSLDYGGKAQALRDVNLAIKPGETVGIYGPSGSGKSSLCMLIPRIYDPDAGTVMIDGTDIRRYTLESLRPQISLVLQDAGVFDLSIAENVAFGLVDWNLDDVIEACRAAELHETIAAMPNGYNTEIGERGARLSGGQRRRIALARALVRKPKILILDEPYEGLDPETAESIRATIAKLARGRTVLIVSHHDKHLTDCTRLIRIESGRIVYDSQTAPGAVVREVQPHG